MANRRPRTEEEMRRTHEGYRQYLDSLTPEQRRERMDRIMEGQRAWRERVRDALRTAEDT